MNPKEGILPAHRSVLMVLESWGSGGTEAYVAQLGAWLHGRYGIRPSVCILGDASEAFASMAAPWAADLWVLNRSRGRRGLALASLLRRHQPDICHLHLYSSLLPASLAARAVRSMRLVTTLHMPLSQWTWRHRLGWRVALALADAITANSRAVLRSAGRWPPGHDTWLTPAPLHPDLITMAANSERRVRGKRREIFLVAGVGRLAPEKDWPTLLRAFAAFCTRCDADAKLLLIGAGPLEPALREWVDRAGIAARVELSGAMPQEELFKRLAEARLFVLPSRFEGLGMAAIEAMALGVPTITADFEAAADYIDDGVTGWRFPRGDHEALARLMHRASEDEAEARAVGERGRQRVLDQFAEDAVFAPFLDAYTREGATA